MGNQGSSPHEPLDRAQAQNNDLKMKSSVRSSFRRARAGGALSPPRAGMERLRRSFRESFRRRKGAPPESARPHQWHADENAVRAGTCTFPVKYLGCVEVFESRGMQVCEEALKVLRNSRRRPVRAVLHISGDGLRVVEEETKGLIVDQTIEKVSFCAPDRSHERGFSYICRDGTTRRWMCHGFLASRDSGERLSHAVGCAFAACLERKQRRDKECAVSMSIDAASHAFTRQGSFRKSVISTRRVSEADPPTQVSHMTHVSQTSPAPPQPAAPRPTAHNPFAVERPHAAPHLLERQGSFRGFAHLNNSSPFKRQMSLRISELPSERQRLGLGSPPRALNAQPAPASEGARTDVSVEEKPAEDPVAAMCQQLSLGLRALTEEHVPNTQVAQVAPTVAQVAPQVAQVTPIRGTALPDPDTWLGRVARAPTLGAAGRAASYAGHSTNPFLTPAPAHLSPFKRQMSLRISELPSERQRLGLGSPPRALNAQPAPASEGARTDVSVEEKPAEDPVAAMCQQLSLGLRALTEEHVPNTQVAQVAPTVAQVAPQVAQVTPIRGTALPDPDTWLGRVARAPTLGAAGRAASYAGHSTNPFLTPAPAHL